MREMQPISDRVWSIETNGINPIIDDDRHGQPLELFWVWFAANLSIILIIFGGILSAAGLNFWQSVLVTLVALIGSFVLVGILSIPGVQAGAPMLTLSRAPFGPRGNLGPALISWISLVGWEIVNIVAAAYALLGLLNLLGLPTNTLWTVVSLAAVAVIMIILGLLGHATVVWIQRAATVIFGLLTLVVGFFLIRSTNWSTLLAQPAGPWDTGVIASLSIIAAASGFGWVNVGADYTRYLPRDTKARAIIGWTTSGATLSFFVTTMIGFLLSTHAKNLAGASNPVAVLGAALPSWMTIPYLVTAIGSLLASDVINLYSSGLSLLSLGVKLQRYKAIFIDGTLMLIGAIYVMFVANNFLGPFESFLQLLADGLMTWAAVFLVDLLWRRNYDPAGLADTSSTSRYYYRGGVNLAAVAAWLIGLVVSLLFTVSPLFVGPFAIGLFASSSLGYFLGFAVSAVVYTIALRFLPAIGTSLKQSLFFPSQTERIPSADS